MKSPCQNICVIDRVSRYCIGCGRTGDEIASWTRFTDGERQTVMDTLPDRMASITRDRPRRGGRRNRTTSEN
ncbi:MAG: DUF1289 domain-containing protein [Pseudomonadota bacterium]